ncbi:hypothetical protein SRHO_G00170730 [Serrasalmus rhombeus]
MGLDKGLENRDRNSRKFNSNQQFHCCWTGCALTALSPRFLERLTSSNSCSDITLLAYSWLRDSDRGGLSSHGLLLGDTQVRAQVPWCPQKIWIVEMWAKSKMALSSTDG